MQTLAASAWLWANLIEAAAHIAVELKNATPGLMAAVSPELPKSLCNCERPHLQAIKTLNDPLADLGQNDALISSTLNTLPAETSFSSMTKPGVDITP